MKKILALVLFGMLGTASMVACNKSDDKKADTTKKDDSKKDDTKKDNAKPADDKGAAPAGGDMAKPADDKGAAPAAGGDSAKPADDKGAAPAAGGDTAAPAAGGDLGSTGIAECDDFIQKYAKCIDKMPDAAKGPAKDSLKQMVDGWKQGAQAAAASPQAKDALVQGCKQAADSMKQASSAYGCEW